VSLTATRYRGHDLLGVMPNAREDRDQAARIAVTELETRTGQASRVRTWPSPVLEHPFLWTLEGRAAITDFLHWVAWRRGRYAEFWMPAWRWDLPVAAAAGSGDDELVIAAIGYTAALFPHECRRHLAILTAAAGVITITPRRVEAAIDNGDGTETLTLDLPLGVAVDADTPVGFLVLVRLASDDVDLVWHHREVVEATVRLVELPRQLAEVAP
jgi:hypothetical protein